MLKGSQWNDFGYNSGNDSQWNDSQQFSLLVEMIHNEIILARMTVFSLAYRFYRDNMIMLYLHVLRSRSTDKMISRNSVCFLWTSWRIQTDSPFPCLNLSSSPLSDTRLQLSMPFECLCKPFLVSYTICICNICCTSAHSSFWFKDYGVKLAWYAPLDHNTTALQCYIQ